MTTPRQTNYDRKSQGTLETPTKVETSATNDSLKQNHPSEKGKIPACTIVYIRPIKLNYKYALIKAFDYENGKKNGCTIIRLVYLLQILDVQIIFGLSILFRASDDEV